MAENGFGGHIVERMKRLLPVRMRGGAVVPVVRLSGVIGAVHTQFPGFVFSLVSGPDSHHNQARFQWGLGPAGEQPPIVGFDVLATDGDGRIRSVHGFLDQVPG